MVYDVTVIVPEEKDKDEAYLKKEAGRILQAKGQRVNLAAARLVVQKRSVDARRSRIKIVFRCKLYIGEEPLLPGSLPQWLPARSEKTVAIVGSGPAGLFGALKLLEKGVRCVIIERGDQVSQRKADIARISREGNVDGDSNYCFGEGGAGCFSDGKLYTRSDKRGNLAQVLGIFKHFGADPAILTAAHPHIGTDRLPAVIDAMRQKIEELGCEFRFNSRCTDFIIEEKDGGKRVVGLKLKDTKDGRQTELACDAVLLATGHSATDIYRTLATLAPDSLEAKGFAFGVRVEHPRELIDRIQYHGDPAAAQKLGAAEYRLTSQVDGRGVYSFCMCPGGFIVPSASEPGQVVINGMSAAGRNSVWSNAAIVVETHPEDIPDRFRTEAEAMGCPALAGLLARTSLEQETCTHGDGTQKAPAQRLVDYLARRESRSLPRTSYTPGVVSSRLDQWLPPHLNRRLGEAFRIFDGKMRGFICDDALLVASETRTSTPARIVRDKESGESPALKGLYPAGEGSGYSGGIASSAMDGMAQCERIMEALGA